MTGLFDGCSHPQVPSDFSSVSVRCMMLSPLPIVAGWERTYTTVQVVKRQKQQVLVRLLVARGGGTGRGECVTYAHPDAGVFNKQKQKKNAAESSKL